MTNKIEKIKKFHVFYSAGCSLLRAKGFFCSLDVHYGGLGKGRLQFLIKVIYNFFHLYFFLIIGHQNP